MATQEQIRRSILETAEQTHTAEQTARRRRRGRGLVHPSAAVDVVTGAVAGAMVVGVVRPWLCRPVVAAPSRLLRVRVLGGVGRHAWRLKELGGPGIGFDDAQAACGVDVDHVGGHEGADDLLRAAERHGLGAHRTLLDQHVEQLDDGVDGLVVAMRESHDGRRQLTLLVNIVHMAVVIVLVEYVVLLDDLDHELGVSHQRRLQLYADNGHTCVVVPGSGNDQLFAFVARLEEELGHVGVLAPSLVAIAIVVIPLTVRLIHTHGATTAGASGIAAGVGGGGGGTSQTAGGPPGLGRGGEAAALLGRGHAGGVGVGVGAAHIGHAAAVVVMGVMSRLDGEDVRRLASVDGELFVEEAEGRQNVATQDVGVDRAHLFSTQTVIVLPADDVSSVAVEIESLRPSGILDVAAAGVGEMIPPRPVLPDVPEVVHHLSATVMMLLVDSDLGVESRAAMPLELGGGQRLLATPDVGLVDMMLDSRRGQTFPSSEDEDRQTGWGLNRARIVPVEALHRPLLVWRTSDALAVLLLAHGQIQTLGRLEINASVDPPVSVPGLCLSVWVSGDDLVRVEVDALRGIGRASKHAVEVLDGVPVTTGASVGPLLLSQYEHEPFKDAVLDLGVHHQQSVHEAPQVDGLLVDAQQRILWFDEPRDADVLELSQGRPGEGRKVVEVLLVGVFVLRHGVVLVLLVIAIAIAVSLLRLLTATVAPILTGHTHTHAARLLSHVLVVIVVVHNDGVVQTAAPRRCSSCCWGALGVGVGVGPVVGAWHIRHDVVIRRTGHGLIHGVGKVIVSRALFEVVEQRLEGRIATLGLNVEVSQCGVLRFPTGTSTIAPRQRTEHLHAPRDGGGESDLAAHLGDYHMELGKVQLVGAVHTAELLDGLVGGPG
mmetsp:Transcript_43638/g.123636  ORF Transcript_43638/g.123636 Transcript_43638/m.123636 type:complete len:884 (+) Transcript_43638:1145-3796(+)